MKLTFKLKLAFLAILLITVAHGMVLYKFWATASPDFFEKIVSGYSFYVITVLGGVGVLRETTKNIQRYPRNNNTERGF